MTEKKIKSGKILRLRARVIDMFSGIPLLGWLIGVLIAVALEQTIGHTVAGILGLPKIPVLFGFMLILKKPFFMPGAICYVLLIYLIPVSVVARICGSTANRVAARLFKLPISIPVLIHLILGYVALHTWADINAYRGIMLKLTLIAIMFTLSLNIQPGL